MREDLTGKTFGKWVVIELLPGQLKRRNRFWLCRCDCKKQIEKPVTEKSLKRKKLPSINCGCEKRRIIEKIYIKDILTKEYLLENFIDKNKTADQISKEIGLKCTSSVYAALKEFNIVKIYNAEKLGDLRISRFEYIKDMANERNLEFNITVEYIWDLFLKQNRKCALTGRNLVIDYDHWTNKSSVTASLDRIDNTKGYIEGNVQWVHKWINLMKLDWSQNEFYEMCKEVYFHCNNKMEIK